MNKIFKLINGNRWIKAVFTVLSYLALFYAGSAVAADQTLGSIAANVKGSFADLAEMITAGSYVAGLGFAIGAILKFKAHKDNPTQIPVGTPVALVFIAAALIFLPSIFSATGATLFGSEGSIAGVTGITTF